MIDFQTYLRGGLIKPQNPDFKQIEQQITRSEKDLKACGMLITADPEWASAIAYQSMLRAGRALLFSKGYLPCDGRQHKTVVEITGEILGKEFASLVFVVQLVEQQVGRACFKPDTALTSLGYDKLL